MQCNAIGAAAAHLSHPVTSAMTYSGTRRTRSFSGTRPAPPPRPSSACTSGSQEMSRMSFTQRSRDCLGNTHVG
jgi:hypothetical protein